MKIAETRKEASNIKESLQWILTDLQQNKGSNYEGDKQLVDNALSMVETLENDDNWEAETNDPDFYWEEWKEDFKTHLQKIIDIDDKLTEDYESIFADFAGKLDAVVWEELTPDFESD